MGLRQSMRPRHQVLVLKCYPRFQKSSIEVKPNSSELSYLLYYASTRRSKLHKVCDYLEKRTEFDVRKAKLGNVQVTLQIVTAILEKCPRDIPLYASSVLATLAQVLRSGDVNFIEESIPTFTAFCQHHDVATLSADPDHTRKFDELVHTYASFALKHQSSKQGKLRDRSTLESLRFRIAGLKALHGLVSSEAFGSDVKHVNSVLPALLDNLYSTTPHYLKSLQQREGADEQYEKDLSLRRRQSMSVQRSAEMQREMQRLPELDEADPSAATVTTEDVDQRSSEEVGVLALKSLRCIFNANNRGQLRTATTVALTFTITHVSTTEESTSPSKVFPSVRPETNWATELFDLMSTCAPVQDRFVILVTVMEFLVMSPIAESDLPRQLTIVSVISWLLRSSINFIGLSVMDVLIGLIQHTLLLLQLGGQGSGVFPHPPSIAGASMQATTGHPLPNLWGQNSTNVILEISKEPSAIRKNLLQDLKHCIGDLANHVYYLDQIGDMISALFARLKPSSTSKTWSAVAAIQDPNATVEAIADSANLQERIMTDGFFSFDTARLLALEAVKEILTVANSRQNDGSGVVGRNRVDVSVWDGTQWLLRDPQDGVRKAYVDALLVWLQYEVDMRSFLLTPEQPRPAKSKKSDREQSESILIAKKVLSNAAQKLDGETRDQSSFLQLLHLAIYENALEYSHCEQDILLLHLLLFNLVQKLGVNCLRGAIPMMFRLQDEVPNLETPTAQVTVASLTQAFFWTISRTFGFEFNRIGEEIHKEISRRTNNHTWLNSMRLPPVPIARFGTLDGRPLDSVVPQSISIPESISLFTMREELVSNISAGYSQHTFSPPTSPHTSPQRSFSRPHLRKASTSSVPTLERTLSTRFISQMHDEWSREACVAAVERDRQRAESMAGSKTNSGSGQRSGPPADSRALNGASNAVADRLGRPSSRGVSPAGNMPVPIRTQPRRLSNRSSPAPVSESSSRSIVRVDDLKRVIAGNYTVPDTKPVNDDESSDSLVTASIPDSTASTRPQSQNGPPAPVQREAGEPSSGGATPTFVTPVTTPAELMREGDPLAHEIIVPDDDVPPVPSLPAGLRAPQFHPPAVFAQPEPTSTGLGRQPSAASKSDGQSRWSAGGRGKSGKVDLQALLSGLDAAEARPGPSVVAAPPY